jgi:hypothetical protein
VAPGNAVLRSQHSGLRSHNRGQIANDSGDLMRLHAENDQILLANVGNSIARLDAADEFPAFFDQGQSVPHNSRKMRASGDDAHVLACTGKFGGQQAADRAGANYANIHG